MGEQTTAVFIVKSNNLIRFLAVDALYLSVEA